MRQGIVTVILGVIGTLIAQRLSEIHASAQNGSLMPWLTDFSNGDVLAMVEILLICYLYARIREVQKAVPQIANSRGGVLRIFGF